MTICETYLSAPTGAPAGTLIAELRDRASVTRDAAWQHISDVPLAEAQVGEGRPVPAPLEALDRGVGDAACGRNARSWSHRGNAPRQGRDLDAATGSLPRARGARLGRSGLVARLDRGRYGRLAGGFWCRR